MVMSSVFDAGLTSPPPKIKKLVGSGTLAVVIVVWKSISTVRMEAVVNTTMAIWIGRSLLSRGTGSLLAAAEMVRDLPADASALFITRFAVTRANTVESPSPDLLWKQQRGNP
jgi:hypothetical protein